MNKKGIIKILMGSGKTAQN